MVAGNGVTGVIKAIHGEGKTAEQLRRADCVEYRRLRRVILPNEPYSAGLSLITSRRWLVALPKENKGRRGGLYFCCRIDSF